MKKHIGNGSVGSKGRRRWVWDKILAQWFKREALQSCPLVNWLETFGGNGLREKYGHMPHGGAKTDGGKRKLNRHKFRTFLA